MSVFSNLPDQPTPTRADRTKISALKGLAIVLVVGVHILTSLPSWVYTREPFLVFFTSLDQLTRFSVPLFVALSGFGFASKFKNTSVAILPFLRSQLFKLMPLYLLWSGVFLAVFTFLPGWRAANDLGPWWGQLLLGRADYHLYFIPMIFQLYLLFPVLLWITKKVNGWLVWAFITVLQLMWYYWLSLAIQGRIQQPWFISDQHQYILGISWLSYFVLGIVVALQSEHLVKYARPVKKYIGVLLGLCLILVVGNSIDLIRSGLDPLFAGRFTKLSVVPYATVIIIGVLVVRHWWEQVPTHLQLLLSQLGKWSFVIYLAHTLVLRIVFSAIEQTASVQDLAIAVLGLALGLFSSYFLLKRS